MHEDDIKSAKLFQGGTPTGPGGEEYFGGASCPPGKVRREGYIATRKKKTLLGRLLKRGTTYRVKSSCVKDRGAKGTLPVVIGPLKQGDLTSKGYRAQESASQRHAALAKAVGAYGRLSTLRKLNAIAVLNKTTSPSRAKTFKTDRDWVKKTYF
jgi:hypothetical protein